MKSTQSRELRGRTEKELKKMIAENESRMVALNFQKMTGHLENSAQIRTLRRDNARINTILQEQASQAVSAQ